MMWDFPFRGETQTLDSEFRATTSSQFVELSAGMTEYEFVGPEDGEVCVLVHGFSVPFFIWDPTVSFLVKSGYRVLRYNLFGRGFSDRPLIKNDVSLFINQLEEILKALSITTPINLFGLSMGGVIAGHYTVKHPERVKRLLLLDPAGFPLGYSWIFKLIRVPILGDLLFNWQAEKQLVGAMGGDFYDKELVDDFIVQYRPQMEMRGFRRSILSTLRAAVLEQGVPAYQVIGRDLTMPVFLVWGEQDTTVPFVHSQTVCQLIPRVEFHPIANTGHIPHYEKPEAVNPLILAFLQADAN